MSLLDLALLCLRLGVLSFGGGIAVLAEMQHDIVDVHAAMTNQDFVDAFGLGQATPGPGILFLIPMGMKIAGPAGALVATISFVLPPLTLTVTLSRILDRLAGSPWATAVNRTLAPMSVGLIAAGLVTVATPLLGDAVAIVGVVVATIAILALNISPTLTVILAGLIWMIAAR